MGTIRDDWNTLGAWSGTVIGEMSEKLFRICPIGRNFSLDKRADIE